MNLEARLCIHAISYHDSSVGLLAGVATSAEKFTGLIVSVWGGVANLQGIQLGVCNIVSKVKGLQAGLLNIISYDQTKGSYALQLGGVNVMYQEGKRISIGIVNHGKNHRGLEVGLYNVAEKFKGVQIGVICHANKGHYLQLGLITVRGHGDEKKMTPLIGYSNNYKTTL